MDAHSKLLILRLIQGLALYNEGRSLRSTSPKASYDLEEKALSIISDALDRLIDERIALNKLPRPDKLDS